VPVRVIYPPAGERVTHFDSVRDPARIVLRVVKTLALTAGLRRAPAPAPIPSVAPPPVARAQASSQTGASRPHDGAGASPG
jgi:hypothetical protein